MSSLEVVSVYMYMEDWTGESGVTSKLSILR